jgi:hypothetical protein
VFKDNQALCEKVDACEVQQIVQLSVRYNTKAPNFLQVLTTLMQPDGHGINTRMQHLVSKLHRDFHAPLEFQVLNLSVQDK